jgi:hypothetical protein
MVRGKMIASSRINQGRTPTISRQGSRRHFLFGSVAMLLSNKLSAEEVPKSDPAPASATPPTPALTFSEQLIHTTVLIRCTDVFKPDAVSSGTGFPLFNFGERQVPALVISGIIVFGLKLPPPFCGTQDAGTKIVNAILLIVANHFLLLSSPRNCGIDAHEKSPLCACG